MRHPPKIEELEAVAQPRRNAVGILRLCFAQRVCDLLEQTSQCRLRELTRTAQPFHFRNCSLQGFWLDRLQEVIDRVDAERLQRVLIEGGGKNDDRLDRQSR